MHYDKIYLLTDACMWEQNKRNKTFFPHSIQVVDIETGQIIYIKSGAKIAFLAGECTTVGTQEEYNKRTETSKVSGDGEDKLSGDKGKDCSKRAISRKLKAKGV